MTVSDYLDTWLASVKKSRRARTHHDYESTVRTHLRPFLGELELARVTPVHIVEMMDSLSARGMSPRTVRKAREVVRNALSTALSEGLISSNPATRSRLITDALPSPTHTERQTLPADSLETFRQAVSSDRLSALFLTLLYTGLRPSEALALLWSDLRDDSLHVARMLVDKSGIPHECAAPKTRKSARAIPLPKVVSNALQGHRRAQAIERLAAGTHWQPDDLIFCSYLGAPLRQDHVRYRFRRLLKAADLPKMRVYDLRHTAASLLLEAGEDLKVVSERLGHSTIALTADTYSHVSRAMQERASGRLDRLAGFA